MRGLRIGLKTTAVEGPLNAHGFPDYATAIERQLGDGITPSENFWCGFCELLDPETLPTDFLTELRRHPGFEKSGTRPFRARPTESEDLVLFENELDQALKGPWKDEESPRVIRWLESNRAALDQASLLSTKRRAFHPFMPTSAPLLWTRLDYLQQARHVAQALACRAKRSLAQERFEEAWRDALAIHRIARHASEGPSVISFFVSGAIEMSAQDLTTSLLVRPRGTPDEIAALWRQLEPTLPAALPIARAIEFERLAVLDITFRCRTELMAVEEYFFEDATIPHDDGNKLSAMIIGHPLTRLLRWKAFSVVEINEQLRYINEFHDRIVDATKNRDFRTRIDVYRSLTDEYLTFPKLRTRHQSLGDCLNDFSESLYKLIRIAMLRKFAVDYADVDNGVTHHSQRVRLIAAVALAEQHYRATGRDVRNGDELLALQELRIPNSAQFSPIDLFTSEPLVVRRQKDELLIYSVGPNGRDDGGRPYVAGEDADDLAARLPRSEK
jgi:hypothetical protein